MAQKAKLPHAVPLSHVGSHSSLGCSTSESASWPGKVSEVDPCPRAPAPTQTWKKLCAPGTVLAVAALCGVNQQMEKISVTLFLLM